MSFLWTYFLEKFGIYLYKTLIWPSYSITALLKNEIQKPFCRKMSIIKCRLNNFKTEGVNTYKHLKLLFNLGFTKTWQRLDQGWPICDQCVTTHQELGEWWRFCQALSLEISTVYNSRTVSLCDMIPTFSNLFLWENLVKVSFRSHRLSVLELYIFKVAVLFLANCGCDVSAVLALYF